MPTIHVVNRAGEAYSIEADVGQSLMQVLHFKSDVGTICGGECA